MEEEFTLNEFMVKSGKPAKQGGNVGKKKKQNKQQQILAFNLINQGNPEQNQINQGASFNDALESFLKRAFLKCKTKKERKEMKKMIIQEIKNTQLAGCYENRDWENTDLPLLSREKIEKNLFNEFNAITQLPQQTEQQLKIVDAIVKKIKEDIMTNNLDQLDNEDNIAQVSSPQSNNNTPALILQQKFNQPLNQQSGNAINNSSLFMATKSTELQNSIYSENIMEEENFNVEHFDEDDFDVERMKVPIIGTSTILEKEYLRLTSYPKASEVRSYETLIKSFAFIKQKYFQRTQDYHYFQSQLRSIRQDLLIQNIKNEFTLQVLEENARICLENYDVQEYSRCLGQLIWMYKDVTDLSKTSYKEFIYYRLVQNIFEDKKDSLLACLQEINQDELLLSVEFEAAMKFQHAITMGNVKGFFNLYNNTKNHGKYLMDLYIKRWKIWGIRIVGRTYGSQSVSVSTIQTIFGFTTYEKAIEELEELNCVLDEKKEKILVKDTIQQLDQIAL